LGEIDKKFLYFETTFNFVQLFLFSKRHLEALHFIHLLTHWL